MPIDVRHEGGDHPAGFPPKSLPGMASAACQRPDGKISARLSPVFAYMPALGLFNPLDWHN
jgi:hypothetical protein